MGCIRRLDKVVAGRIAAGEVVNRPAAIVKELVENSVDSGATSISIEVKDGGVRYIRVVDNGVGIEHDDMPLTIEKHATSKIVTLEDLESTHTMGFRGEALFSISTVSVMMIRSRTNQAEMGTEMRVRGGEIEYLRNAGVPQGTSICVENLFFNTPARLKFLKSLGVETAAITNYVGRLILSNPGVSVRYTSGNSIIYHSSGTGDLKDAMMTVHGVDIKSRIIPIRFEQNGMKVSGYISSPEFPARTRKESTLIVNGRYVQSNKIFDIVHKSYGERLLKGRFPLFVINLDTLLSDVDANVHPNKLSVRFRDDNAVEYAISMAVAQALGQSTYTPRIVLTSKDETEYKITEKAHKGHIEAPADVLSKEVNKDKKPEPKIKNEKKNKITKQKDNSYSDDILVLDDAEIKSKVSDVMSMIYSSDSFPEVVQFAQNPDFGYEEKQPSIPSLLKDELNLKLVGSIFDTYILMETEGAVYIIDQHAAHERLIYDKLLADERQIIQPLLVPYEFSVTHEEKILLEDNQEVLDDMGVAIRTKEGLTCELLELPQVLESVRIEEMIADVLEVLGGSAEPKLTKDRIARAACRSAVKAGEKLPNEFVRRLVEDMRKQGSIPHCPHGRPIIMALTLMDIEKGFGRR